jgi:hypothetical protein
MGERGLTFKQRKFAELLAGGSTRVAAFREAFPSAGRSKGTEYEGAKRVGRLPKVAAEVQRLTLLRSPHDATAQAEHVAARLLELMKDSNPEISLRAISRWSALCVAGILKPPPISQRAENGRQPSADEKRQILDELKALYQKAVPRPQNSAEQLDPPIRDVAELHDSVIDDEPADRAIIVPSLLMAANGVAGKEVSVNGSPKRVAPVQMAEPLRVPPGEFEFVAIPGCFPPTFRRVRRS